MVVQATSVLAQCVTQQREDMVGQVARITGVMDQHTEDCTLLKLQLQQMQEDRVSDRLQLQADRVADRLQHQADRVADKVQIQSLKEQLLLQQYYQMQQKQGGKKKKSKQRQGKRTSTPATATNATTAIAAPASRPYAIADATISDAVTAIDTVTDIECALGDIGCLSAPPSVTAPTVNAPPPQPLRLLLASAASLLVPMLLVLALVLAPAPASSMGASNLVLQRSELVRSRLTWPVLHLVLLVTAGACLGVRPCLTAVSARWVFDDAG